MIHVCPVCGFYDADPVLRRMPGSRHGAKRCFACARQAEEALDLSRVASSYHAHYKQQARDSAPVLVPTKVRMAEAYVR